MPNFALGQTFNLGDVINTGMALRNQNMLQQEAQQRNALMAQQTQGLSLENQQKALLMQDLQGAVGPQAAGLVTGQIPTAGGAPGNALAAPGADQPVAQENGQPGFTPQQLFSDTPPVIYAPEMIQRVASHNPQMAGPMMQANEAYQKQWLEQRQYKGKTMYTTGAQLLDAIDKGKDPVTFMKIVVPEMYQQLKAQGVDVDHLKPDQLQQMAGGLKSRGEQMLQITPFGQSQEAEKEKAIAGFKGEEERKTEGVKWGLASQERAYTREAGIRKELTEAVTTQKLPEAGMAYSAAHAAFQQAQREIHHNGNPAFSDAALITQVIKLQNPNARINNGVVENYTDLEPTSQLLAQKLRETFLGKQALGVEERKALLHTADVLYKEKKVQHDNIVESFKARAREAGADPSHVIVNYGMPAAPKIEGE
jgi:hypothetical protein